VLCIGSSIVVQPCTAEPTDVTEEFVIPANEEWVVNQDPRRKVCDNFVQGNGLSFDFQNLREKN